MVNTTEDIIMPESPNVHSQQTAVFYVQNAGEYTENAAGNDKKGVASFLQRQFIVENGKVRLRTEYLTDILNPLVQSASESAKTAADAKEYVVITKNTLDNLLRSLGMEPGDASLRKLTIGTGQASDLSIAGGTTDKSFIEDVAREIFGDNALIDIILPLLKLNPSKAEAPLSIALGADNVSSVSGAVTFGYSNNNSGWCSISIGALNEILGAVGFTIGYKNKISDNYGVVIGQENEAGNTAFAGGILSKATGKGSFAFGNENTASNEYAVAFGGDNTASGIRSFASGTNTIASGNYAHSEGWHTTASGAHSHSEGSTTEASGVSAHTEGWKTKATAEGAHAEGFETQATADAAHAEGNHTVASGTYAHAEGSWTEATGNYSHAEGDGCKASQVYAHAEGYRTQAKHSSSHASGRGTITGRDNQTVVGQYNKVSDKALFIVGDGSSNSNRTNIFEVNDDGTATLNGKLIVTQDYIDNKIEELRAQLNL